ncbi:hypothetical protein M422DRAFT_60316 [Sphaerobolus stellatus SS14]|uniref:Acyl-CoA oxidase C-alpha1 domain-containing protein n=1 Tax=Sphaerobolus stellatus (strain SS14) TaxID=990650 RepID=A0A0C9VYA1_SPHS4|nr:hypothetical protein M422DRAFT_60316 [Sphaerobolus stellatus SS14]
MQKTASLAQEALFQRELPEGDIAYVERIKLSYSRAKAVTQIYDLSVRDVLELSPKYWEFHTDPILVMDSSVGTLLTIQYNLCLGTLGSYRENRKELQALMTDVLRFRVSGQYCLTEVNHGLNAINIETTATLQPNGDFILHTPHPGAAKYMPPTAPFGIPCVAIVFARLIINGEDHGIRGFVVKLHDGFKMTEGIICRNVQLLPARGASRPVGHSLTYFSEVRLYNNALLGDMRKPKDTRELFFNHIHRVISGTLSMGAVALSALRIGCYIGIAYSLRRNVQVLEGAIWVHRPISSFSTQYIPLLAMVAQSLVFESYGQETYERFVDSKRSITQRHLLAAIFKTTVFRHTLDMLLEIGDRCGAQGLFEANQLSVIHADMRGAAIAEGDILGISIRFAIDIVRNKVQIPAVFYEGELLARHEDSIIAELKILMNSWKNHRSLDAERNLLPHCRGVLEAIGHRCAYEAARSRGLPQPIIDLFVASLLERDAAWYSENAKLSRLQQKKMLLDRATTLYQDLPKFLPLLRVESYITAPIVSEERWNSFVSRLPVFSAKEVGVPFLDLPDQTHFNGMVSASRKAVKMEKDS